MDAKQKKKLKNSALLKVLDQKYGTPSPTNSAQDGAGHGIRAATPRLQHRTHLGVQLTDVELSHIQIKACTCPDCKIDASPPPSDPRTQSHALASTSAPTPVPWCSHDVALSDVDWLQYTHALQAGRAGGNQALTPRLPQGLSFVVADTEETSARAVDALRKSMKDRFLSIDLEWTPEGLHGVPPNQSLVALVQVASGTLCALFRVNKMRFKLPSALTELLDDPSVTFVGHGWRNADEKMFQRTFCRGWRDFRGGFVDVQDVACELGYARSGLASLTHFILGFEPPKSKSVSKSHWGSGAPLKANQLMYAAMDAFLQGYIFRSLRSHHAAVPRLLCHKAGCQGMHALGWAAPSGKAHLRGPLSGAPPVPLASCGGCGRIIEVAEGQAVDVEGGAERGPSDSVVTVGLKRDAGSFVDLQKTANKKVKR